jgi:membrane-associated phospholipid phosphatase
MQLRYLTDFGDSAILFPIGSLLLIWLISEGRRRAALTWFATFGSALFLVAATKIAFLGWGIGIPAVDFTGLSGHSAESCAVLPVVAWLIVGTRPAWLPRAAALAGVVAGSAIGASRVFLEVHSISEVILGCTVGLAVSAATLYVLALEKPQRRLPLQILAAASGMLLIVLHGERVPTTDWLTRVALFLSGHEVPYAREHWHHTAASEAA